MFNVNQEACKLLEPFDAFVRDRLAESSRLHTDATGITVGGKLQWLQGAANDDWTFFYPHAKRGTEAMDAIGSCPDFGGSSVTTPGNLTAATPASIP